MKREIIWMLLLVIGTLSNLVYSCKGEVDRSQLQQFIYVNNSNYTILINKYINNNIKNEYLISKNDSLIQEIDLGFGSTENLIIYSDSVNVVFENSKILRFKLNDNVNRNLLKMESYESYRKNDVIVNKYIFTNTDYQKAEDCTGNCK